MGFQEKAVWCQAACNVLSFAILLPPVGMEDSDARLRRQALPHIEYMRRQEDRIQEVLQEKQKDRVRSWPSVELRLNRARLLRDAKFGLVYAECGLFLESQKLLLGIDRYLVQAIGLDDPVAIRARTFLSETYWWLGKEDNCLLYTSPSPRDGLLSRMPSSA